MLVTAIKKAGGYYLLTQVTAITSITLADDGKCSVGLPKVLA